MHHRQIDVLETIRIYSTAATLKHQYSFTARTLTYQYNMVKCFDLIIYLELIMATYSDELMVTYLVIHLEMGIEHTWACWRK